MMLFPRIVIPSENAPHNQHARFLRVLVGASESRNLLFCWCYDRRD
jgi:hypothetical protein